MLYIQNSITFKEIAVECFSHKCLDDLTMKRIFEASENPMDHRRLAPSKSLVCDGTHVEVELVSKKRFMRIGQCTIHRALLQRISSTIVLTTTNHHSKSHPQFQITCMRGFEDTRTAKLVSGQKTYCIFHFVYLEMDLIT